MKTIKKILLIIICLPIAYACEDNTTGLNKISSLSADDHPGYGAEIIAGMKTVTLPLKLKFTTLASPIEGELCSPPNFTIQLEGEGTGTH